MKEEMGANRKEANNQMKMMQTQRMMFQSMMVAMLPKKCNPPNQSDSKSNHSQSHSADTQVTQTAQHKHNTRSQK